MHGIKIKSYMPILTRLTIWISGPQFKYSDEFIDDVNVEYSKRKHDLFMVTNVYLTIFSVETIFVDYKDGS